jgi:acetolactate synthase-1/3 small subunit
MPEIHPFVAPMFDFPLTSGGAAVLQLEVRNPAGAMSHISELFARRDFSLEAMACAALGSGGTSRVLLLVGREAQLEDAERELKKLPDVLSVQERADLGSGVFAEIARC